MILKNEYLQTGDESAKKVFREFQMEGDEALSASHEAMISPWSRFLLSFGYPALWRDQREKNVRFLHNLMQAEPTVQPLFSSWPAHHCPFNTLILFPSTEKRQECRSKLITAGIYPAVHWELSPTASVKSLDLSRRILTIPADQRYDAEDLQRVATVLFGGLRHV